MRGKTGRQIKAAANANATGPAGTTLRLAGKHGPQLIETQGRFWSDEAEAIFLDCLAATCNVSRAAREAGFSGTAVWRRRRRDAGFAGRWQEALTQGYVRLETAIVRRAADRFDGGDGGEDGDGNGNGDGNGDAASEPTVTTAEAINLLRLHKAGVAGGHARAGRRSRPRPLAEVHASILVKLEAIVAMNEADAVVAAERSDEAPDV